MTASFIRPEVSRRIRVRAPLRFEVEEQALAVEPSLDYRIRVDTCGLCRSDLHFAESWAREWDDLGHEFGGTVVAVRRSGGRFRIGDRVAVKNASACGECRSCAVGDARYCSALIVNKQGFSEYADCDERSLVDATGLNDDLLALVEPTNVALDLIHSARIRTAVPRVAVLGSGTLGLITAFLLEKRFGLANVAVLGRQASVPAWTELRISRYARLEDAISGGWLDRNLGGRPQVVLVTSPPVTLSSALDLVAPGGRILTVGLDRNEGLDSSIDVRTLIFRRASLEGVFAVPNLYFDEAVEVLRSVGKPLAALITERVELSDLPRVFVDWAARAHFGGKLRLGRPMPTGEVAP